MNIKEFLSTNVVTEERFARFNHLDPERMDYTLQVQKPDGQVIVLRNPGEADDGASIDKCHTVPTGTILLAAGTAFWDWRAKKQHSVGVDIDTDDNHQGGLKSEQFEAALDAVHRVPWLEARRSSGGKGLHVFPRFTQPVDVASRAEASALARAVLTLASREADFDFKAAKDCAGGNMWIFKADAAPNAYEVIKTPTTALDLVELPPGWREAKEASKRNIRFAPSTVKLSPEHLEIEKQLSALGFSIIYEHEHGCYHIHTRALQIAHEKHGYRGHFATVSKGTNPSQPNGYMFPLPGGAFLVKRFSKAKEDSSWFSGPNGQYAFLNVEVPYKKAVEHFSINLTTKGFAYSRGNLESMLKAVGASLEVPQMFEGRTFFVRGTEKIAQLIVEYLSGERHLAAHDNLKRLMFGSFRRESWVEIWCWSVPGGSGCVNMNVVG